MYVYRYLSIVVVERHDSVSLMYRHETSSSSEYCVSQTSRELPLDKIDSTEVGLCTEASGQSGHTSHTPLEVLLGYIICTNTVEDVLVMAYIHTQQELLLA